IELVLEPRAAATFDADPHHRARRFSFENLADPSRRTLAHRDAFRHSRLLGTATPPAPVSFQHCHAARLIVKCAPAAGQLPPARAVDPPWLSQQRLRACLTRPIPNRVADGSIRNGRARPATPFGATATESFMPRHFGGSSTR